MIGLISDVHLACFLLDPAARAAAADDARLISTATVDAAQRVLLTLHHNKPMEQGVIVASLQQWVAGSGGSFRPYISGANAIFATSPKKLSNILATGASLPPHRW